MTLEEWNTIFSGLTLFSVIFLALNYKLDKDKAKLEADLSKDKEICGQAEKAIERAYISLTGENGSKVPPEPSRLNWLTSARLIIKFNELKAQLNTDLYKLICSEHEAHWKHQFYLCLNHNELQSESYYQGNDMLPISSENIDLRSALIIANFTQWSPDLEDPILNVDKNKLINDGYTLNGRFGIKEYINILDNEKKAIKSDS